MTRFQIVGIFEDKILTAGEFNGDGYFEGHGKEVCGEFAKITTEEEYRKVAKDMNDKNFEYEGEIIYDITDYKDENGDTIDIFNFYMLKQKNLYYRVWFSDYLYIKNFSEEDKEIVDENGIKIIVHPQGWITINFGCLYKKEDYTIIEDCQNNIEIDVGENITNICEEHGWSVSTESDDMLYISKYTPEGEDFGFDISAADAIEEIKKYANNFDVDEHVKMWINSGASGVPRIRDLLEDAEWIDDELQELARAFEK